MIPAKTDFHNEYQMDNDAANTNPSKAITMSRLS